MKTAVKIVQDRVLSQGVRESNFRVSQAEMEKDVIYRKVKEIGKSLQKKEE